MTPWPPPQNGGALALLTAWQLGKEKQGFVEQKAFEVRGGVGSILQHVRERLNCRQPHLSRVMRARRLVPGEGGRPGPSRLDVQPPFSPTPGGLIGEGLRRGGASERARPLLHGASWTHACQAQKGTRSSQGEPGVERSPGDPYSNPPPLRPFSLRRVRGRLGGAAVLLPYNHGAPFNSIRVDF